MQIRVCTRRYVAHTIYDGQFIEMAGLLSSPVFFQTFLGLPRRISAGIYSRVRVYYVYTHIQTRVECDFCIRWHEATFRHGTEKGWKLLAVVSR